MDLILSSSPAFVSCIDYSNGFSYHMLFQVTLAQPKNAKNTFSKMIRDFSRADYAAINQELIACYEAFLNSIDEHAALTSRGCGGAVNGTAHAQTLHVNSVSAHAQCPHLVWANAGLFVNSKWRLFRKAKQNRSVLAWDCYYDSLKEYTRQIKMARHKYCNRGLPIFMQSNPKKF
ncbi:unnamed protein product [Ixodes persulcatus]